MALATVLVLLALAYPAHVWSVDTDSVSYDQVKIDVDASGNVGWIRSLQGVNGGPVPRGPDVAPLYEQYRSIGVDFVRTHDDYLAFDISVVFPNMKADPSNEASYDFGSTDSEVQGIISVSAQILYRLGYSGGGGSSEVPADYAHFAEICKHLVMHYNQGWAKGFEYGIRYWEIWNEPNIGTFWKGTSEQYFRLYDAVARALKATDPEIRVGGPAAILGRVFVMEFLQFCRANKSPLDFLSWHIYPENQPYLVAEAALQIQDLLRMYGFENTENFITEWNFSARSAELSNEKGSAWASSVLVYLQDTSVSRAFWYRGNGGNYSLFLDNGDFSRSGYAFLAMKKMLETPMRLTCSGSDKAGFAVLAGRSENNHALRVLISNYDSEYEEFALTVKNWDPSGVSVQAEIYVLNDSHDLALVNQFELAKGEPLTITSQMMRSSVYLISLQANQGTSDTSTQQTVTTTTSPQQEPLMTTQETAVTTTQEGREFGVDFGFAAIGIGAVTVLGVGVAASSRQRSEVFVHGGYYYCRKHRVPALYAKGRLWCPVEHRYLRA
jgi:xylan 1,4-beta-xylosidase